MANTNPTNLEGSRYFTPEVETPNMPNQYWGRLTKSKHLVDYKTGLPNARIYGQSMIGYPQGGIDIGAPAFASYEAYVRTYIDELGHVGHSTFHSRLFDIWLHFETTEFGYLRDRKRDISR